MTKIAETEQILIAYSYDPEDFHLIGSFEYHWAIGTGLAANSTDIKPPSYSTGEIPVFNEDQQKWSIVEDHRLKTAYSLETKSELHVDYIGPIKSGYTLQKPNSIFDQWNGSEWIDLRTPEEIEAHRLSLFPALKRRQFMRVLVLNGFDLDQIEAEINKIPDTQTRQLALIDWKDATEFWRTDETLLMVADLLGLDTARIDAMWEQASTL